MPTLSLRLRTMKLIRKRGNAEKEIQLNGELSGKKTRTDPSPEGIQMHSLSVEWRTTVKRSAWLTTTRRVCWNYGGTNCPPPPLPLSSGGLVQLETTLICTCRCVGAMMGNTKRFIRPLYFLQPPWQPNTTKDTISLSASLSRPIYYESSAAAAVWYALFHRERISRVCFQLTVILIQSYRAREKLGNGGRIISDLL